MHPEAYPLARRIITDAQARNGAHWVAGTLGTSDGTDPLAGLNPADYVQDSDTQASADEGTAGVYTVEDIFTELRRPAWTRAVASAPPASPSPSRTSRTCAPAWCSRAPSRMWRHSGAFVDIGVHQDGLVHISQMSRGYVANPHDIVRSGDIVQVRVVEVDLARRRISLSLLVEDED